MKTSYVIYRLLQYVSRYKSELFILVVISISGVLFTVSNPLPIKVVIDYVLVGDPLPEAVRDIIGEQHWLYQKDKLLLLCIAVLIFLAVGGPMVALLVTYKTTKLGLKLVYDLSIDLYSKMQRLSLSFYSSNQVGDLLQRFNGDVFTAFLLIGQIALPVTTSLIALGAMFTIMAMIDLTLAIIALSVVPLLVILLMGFSKPITRSTTIQYRTQGELSAFVQQTLVSMKMIQAYVREAYMFEKLEKRAGDFSNAFFSATKISASYNQITNLITGMAGAFLVGLGAFKSLQGNVTVGDLYVFLGYITALYGPVNSLSTAIGATLTIGARGKRVFEVLDSEEFVYEIPNAVKLINPKGKIEFDNVFFGYGKPSPGNDPVVKNINLTVEPGQIIAVIGPTGAGKTTLISLLTRFHDPWTGAIRIDGVDIKNLNLHSLRESISLVLQEPFIFPMTAAENIAFGNPEASLDQIKEAAKRSMANDFIEKLPQGYETVITESGNTLSGGEKQRICLARAFLKQTPILILDEPTSALDALTEAKIFKDLAEHTRGRTVFLISHRLSTIKHANKIITINHGEIVEDGTHESLIEHGALYAELYKQQHIN